MGSRRGRIAWATFTLVGAVAAALAGGGLAAGDRADPGTRAQRAQASNETLEFVNVEIDRTGMLFPDKWVISENSASLDTDLYTHTHTWSIPRTIPPSGAQATVTTSATDKSGGTVSAKTTLFGYVNIDGTTAVEVVANADKNAGQPTVTVPRTVTLTPRGGGPVFITARVQDGPDVKFNYRIVTPPPPPPPPVPPPTQPPAALPAITPRSTLPRIGVLTSYAAPRPLGTLVLGFPTTIPARATSITADVTPTRGTGLKIDDPGFIAAVEPSRANAERATRLCLIFYFSEAVPLFEYSWGTGLGLAEFLRCTSVVARILQRAEENRLKKLKKGQPARAAKAAGCRSATVRPRGSRARSPLSVTCTRTDRGLRVTIRSSSRKRSLRSAAGRASKLIVGHSRLAKAERGDRVNVLWKASP